MSPESLGGSIASIGSASAKIALSVPTIANISISPISETRPSASLINELNAPLTPIQGEFTIEDIIRSPQETAIDRPQISPVSLSYRPQIEEITIPASFVSLFQEEEVANPQPHVEGLQTVMAAQLPNIAPSKEAEEMTVNSEVATEIPIQLKSNTQIQESLDQTITKQLAEARANNSALEDSIATLVTLGFGPEEETWKKKLEMAAIQPQIETSTEEDLSQEVATEAALQTEDNSFGEPPTGTVNFSDGEEKPKEVPVSEPKKWTVYDIDQNWEIAQDINQERRKVAQELTSEAYAKPTDARADVEEKVFMIDTVATSKQAEVMAEDLKIPMLADDIYRALSWADDFDAQQVEKTVFDILEQNPSKRKVRKIEQIYEVEQEKLPKDAQKLAREGAKNLVLKLKKGWKKVSKLYFRNPQEAEKSKTA